MAPRPIARPLPWLVAVVCLAIPVVGSGLQAWLWPAIWGALLVTAWAISRQDTGGTRAQRIVLAVGLLPVLFLLGWEGGWYLIPADLTWLLLLLVGAHAGARRTPAHT